MLTSRQKLLLFESNPPTEITFESLVASTTTPETIRASKLTISMLKELGMESCLLARQLGFDAMDLADGPFAADALAAFGRDAVVDAFLGEAGDAVCLAGSAAATILKISVEELLQRCVAAPEEAAAVLQQQVPRALALSGVGALTLLDTGLRAPQLIRIGIDRVIVEKLTGARGTQLELLGF
jgi:hypothetical protein